jgi:predicted nucleic acid-binding protein
MIYLLDTTAFSDLMREHPATEQHLRAVGATDAVRICTIVRGEIRYGIERLPHGRRRQELETKANTLFRVISCEAVPESAGDEYGRVKAESQRKGLALDENDLWIAASALMAGATLVTRDSDYRRVDGLSVVDWTS